MILNFIVSSDIICQYIYIYVCVCVLFLHISAYIWPKNWNYIYSHPQTNGKVNPYEFNGDLLFHLFGDDYRWRYLDFSLHFWWRVSHVTRSGNHSGQLTEKRFAQERPAKSKEVVYLDKVAWSLQVPDSICTAAGFNLHSNTWWSHVITIIIIIIIVVVIIIIIPVVIPKREPCLRNARHQRTTSPSSIQAWQYRTSIFVREKNK